MENETSALTLVLLPGLNGTTGLFKPFNVLVPKGFKTVAISFPSQEKMSYQQLTHLVIGELANVDGDFILVGESFSGPLSLFIAEHNPSGLLGLVLVASFIESPNIRLGRFLPWSLFFAIAKPCYAACRFLINAQPNSLIALIATELQKVSPAILADRVKSVFNVDAALALKNCPVPVVYFRATQDIVVPRKNLRKVISIRPSIKVVEFNTSHFLLQVAPASAWSAIIDFARSLGYEARL